MQVRHLIFLSRSYQFPALLDTDIILKTELCPLGASLPTEFRLNAISRVIEAGVEDARVAATGMFSYLALFFKNSNSSVWVLNGEGSRQAKTNNTAAGDYKVTGSFLHF